MDIMDNVNIKPVASVYMGKLRIEHLSEKKTALWFSVCDSLAVSSEDPFGPISTNTSSIKSSDVFVLLDAASSPSYCRTPPEIQREAVFDFEFLNLSTVQLASCYHPSPLTATSSVLMPLCTRLL